MARLRRVLPVQGSEMRDRRSEVRRVLRSKKGWYLSLILQGGELRDWMLPMLMNGQVRGERAGCFKTDASQILTV